MNMNVSMSNGTFDTMTSTASSAASVMQVCQNSWTAIHVLINNHSIIHRYHFCRRRLFWCGGQKSKKGNKPGLQEKRQEMGPGLWEDLVRVLRDNPEIYPNPVFCDFPNTTKLETAQSRAINWVYFWFLAQSDSWSLIIAELREVVTDEKAPGSHCFFFFLLLRLHKSDWAKNKIIDSPRLCGHFFHLVVIGGVWVAIGGVWVSPLHNYAAEVVVAFWLLNIILQPIT